MAIINYLVEGEIDEAVIVRLLNAVNHETGVGYGKRGSGYIKQKIGKFNLTAKSMYYLALVDFMDTDCACPPEVVANWLPHKNERMIFRVVVREIESWLLADRKNIARFLQVGVEKIPSDPEAVADPKQKLVNLARNSRSKNIRFALVPEQNSTAQVGKLYISEIKRFVSDFWDVDSARYNSPSLDKCLSRLEEI